MIVMKLLFAESQTVKSSLDQLYRSFPTDRFNYMFPPVVFRHQLYRYCIFYDKLKSWPKKLYYSLVTLVYVFSCLPHKTRTEIDREVSAMRNRKEIRCIKLGFTGDELALVKRDSFREHVVGELLSYRSKTSDVKFLVVLNFSVLADIFYLFSTACTFSCFIDVDFQRGYARDHLKNHLIIGKRVPLNYYGLTMARFYNLLYK